MRFIGGDQPPAHQIKEPKPKLRLGVAKNFADGGLRDIERPRRRADRPIRVNRVKNLDLPQSHGVKLAARYPRR
jgi:hypothetical protein